MMWPTAPLRKIAPPMPASFQSDPEETVWHLSLDQIESETGEIVGKRYAPASEAGNSTFYFDAGNVLYSKLRPYLNKVALPDEAGVATTELIPLRPEPSILHPRYLAYYLRSPGFVNQASHHVSGAKMPRVVMDWFWAHELPLPPPKEQSRIVELLDEADRLRKLRREADSKAARILTALFLKMFGDPKSNPMGWPVKPLGKIATVNWGNTSITKASYAKSGFTAFSASGADGYLADFEHDEDGIVLSAIGARCGKCFWASGKWTAIKNTITVVKPQKNISLLYLFQILDNENIWSKRGGGQPFIALGDARSLPIMQPPEQMQASFHAKARDVRVTLRSLEDLAGKVEVIFALLLQHAFSGQLTAKWRDAHLKELLAEMTKQAHALNLPLPKEQRSTA